MVGGSSPGTPASSTTKTGRHDIAESGIKHNKSNQINYSLTPVSMRGVLIVTFSNFVTRFIGE
jgi:hypothetical protein